MTATIHPIAPQSRVDEAWDEYLTLEMRQAQRPELRVDRPFQDALIRARYRYDRLLTLQDRGL